MVFQVGQKAKDKRQELVGLLGVMPLVSSRDLVRHGFNRMDIHRFVKHGLLERDRRGFYVHPEMPLAPNHDWVYVAQKAPRAVLNLLTALEFYWITTQAPPNIWIMLPTGVTAPKISRPSLMVTRCAPTPYSYGIETHWVAMTKIRVTSPAKTVADCFKFRHKIGTELLDEILIEYRRRGYKLDALLLAADVIKIRPILQPYLEKMKWLPKSSHSPRVK